MAKHRVSLGELAPPFPRKQASATQEDSMMKGSASDALNRNAHVSRKDSSKGTLKERAQRLKSSTTGVSFSEAAPIHPQGREIYETLFGRRVRNKDVFHFLDIPVFRFQTPR